MMKLLAVDDQVRRAPVLLVAPPYPVNHLKEIVLKNQGANKTKKKTSRDGLGPFGCFTPLSKSAEEAIVVMIC